MIAAAHIALADCRDEWICVDTVDQGGNVELRAKNLQSFPITYTLRVLTHDRNVDGPKTVTRTLAANQSEQVMVLSAAGARGQRDYQYSIDWTVGDKDAVHDDDHLYSLPYASGKSYRVVQGYGSRFSHTGLEEYAVDLDMPVGTPIHAARSGIVARVEESHDKGCWQDGCGKFANYVVILHSDGTTGEYYHLKKNGALVEVGDSVAQGQKIAYSGNTGHSTMPHLHFAVYRAIDWGNTQSIPVRFQGADGIINRPRRGGRYQAY
ncbi:MAG: M23 family metallopeptidase [Gammaproteobacteria bacterium]|nr:M23 family metallopeptidase [Gammaproteobacteria bacterium]